jgi:hypothetical protein
MKKFHPERRCSIAALVIDKYRAFSAVEARETRKAGSPQAVMFERPQE